MGILTTQIIGNPYLKFNAKATNLLLKISVVGLGFGMNLFNALEVGQKGMALTITSIVITIVVGVLVGRLLGIHSKITQLISSGTAICGGSAIAAISPLINAKEKHISVALGIVFILNAVALFVFPPIGSMLNLSQDQFGLWSAIAIHDTSSVIGASTSYGARALEVATTVKLSRALWIIPLSLAFMLINKGGTGKVKIPYFIGLFILAMIINTFTLGFDTLSPFIVTAAKALLRLTLFLIGAGLSLNTLKTVGPKPLLLGIGLWLLISVLSLVAILYTT